MNLPEPTQLPTRTRTFVPWVGEWIGRRYALTGILGAGSEAAVYRAQDAQTGATVAVKVFHHVPPGQMRRGQIAVLRTLRIPGIPILLDEGIWRGHRWFSQVLVEGRRFGETDEAGQVADCAGLFRVLARLHAARVAHLDLKPENVIVDANGLVWLVDFGLCRGLGAGVADGSGTPAWMAPEQAAGRAWLPADLWSAGAMLFTMWTGLRAKPDETRLRMLRPDLPGTHVALVEQLLRAAPSARPTAAQAAAVLGVSPPRWRAPPEADTVEGLARLVAGPEPFLHLPSRVATALHANGPVEVRINRLLATGRAEWRDGRLHVDAGAIPLIEARPAPTAVAPLVWDGRLDEAERQAMLHRGGQRALQLAQIALEREEPAALDRALAELAKAPRWPAELDRTWSLCLAWAAWWRGDLEAAARLSSAPAPADALLSGWHRALHVAQAMRAGRGDAVLTALEPWALESPANQGRWCGWYGVAAYRRGDWLTAASQARVAATLRPTRAGRISAQLGLLSALCELGSFDEAVTRGDAVAAEADGVGLAARACAATTWARVARYRRGDPGRARPELVDAAGYVHAPSAAVLALNEAAFAWRAGDPLARPLAEVACARFAAREHTDGHVLATALAVRLGASLDTPTGLDRLRPEVAWQAAALLHASGRPVPRPTLTFPSGPPHQRLDLLTPAEIRALLP